jgi:hypothetical protein
MGGASYYSPDIDRIFLGFPSDTGITQTGKVAVHELAHWIDKKAPIISEKAEEIFYKRLERDRQQGERNPIANHKHGYRVYKDKFIDEYMGRIYNMQDGPEVGTEFFSVGLEYLFYNPKKLARQDPEMFDFVVWALTGKPMS